MCGERVCEEGGFGVTLGGGSKGRGVFDVKETIIIELLMN